MGGANEHICEPSETGDEREGRGGKRGKVRGKGGEERPRKSRHWSQPDRPGNGREPARVGARGLGDIWERWTEEGSAWGPGGPRKSARTMDVCAEGRGWETAGGCGGRLGLGGRSCCGCRPGTARGRGRGAGSEPPARVWSAPRSSRSWARAAWARPPAHSEAVLAYHWLLLLWWGGAPLPGKKCNCVKKSSPG